MNKTTTGKLLIFLLLFPILLSAQKRVKESDLLPKYQDFIALTSYIMYDQEKDVFMKLETDRDRDIFIEAFWKQRDPTPGTPQNEYKELIIERFNYVNKRFKYGTPRPGWMTDQGRFYMILGEPTSREPINSLGIHPCEIWYYYGDSSLGLPAHFGLVFFRRGGMGEYKLYDPVADGPNRLLEPSVAVDPTDYEDLYEKIKELAPTLSLVSHSMVPGDIPMGYQPSPINNIYLANILESPKKNVNPQYATHFLDLIGMVEVEYMTNMIASDDCVSLIRDPMTNLDFLHFSIAPKTISVDYYQPNDQYFCSFKISVSLRQEEKIIFQYTRDFPFYFSPDDLDNIQAKGVAIEDSFPLIPGHYQLVVLLQNAVGKEFSLLEKDVFVPEDTGSPQIVGPVLGYRFENYQPNIHIPFKVLDQKLIVDPLQTFSRSDQIAFFFTLTNIDQRIWEAGRVKVQIKGMKPNDPFQKSFDLLLSSHPFRRNLVMSQALSGEEFVPDYYQINLDFIDGEGKSIAEESGQFIVTQETSLSHPMTHTKGVPLTNSFLYHFMLAQQYEQIGNVEKAQETYARAYAQNPEFQQGFIDYAHFLLKTQKFTECVELVEQIKDNEPMKFQYLSIKGRALSGLGQYRQAIELLLEGNAIYNSDTNLLNSLGFSYYKTGEKQKALEALNSSLRLNSSQDEVKRMIAEIEKELK